MCKREALRFALLPAALPASAQDTRPELRPELDLYAQGEQTRILFRAALDHGDNVHYSQRSSSEQASSRSVLFYGGI